MRLSSYWFLCSTFWLIGKSKEQFPAAQQDDILHPLYVWLLISKRFPQLSDAWGFSILLSKNLGLCPIYLSFQKVDSNPLFVLSKRIHHNISFWNLQLTSEPPHLVDSVVVHPAPPDCYSHHWDNLLMTGRNFLPLEYTFFFNSEISITIFILKAWCVAVNGWIRNCCRCWYELIGLNFSMVLPKYLKSW